MKIFARGDNVSLPTSDKITNSYNLLRETSSATQAEKDYAFTEQLNILLEKGISDFRSEMEEKLNKQREEIVLKFNSEIESVIQDNSKRIEDQQKKSIELIGLFAAVISFVIANITIVAHSETFFGAVLLICGSTFSMCIFAAIIHAFFTEKSALTLGRKFWIPVLGLAILLFVGGYFYICHTDLYRYNIEKNADKTDLNNSPQQNKISSANDNN